MENGIQISFFKDDDNSSAQSQIPDNIIFYILKIIGELGLAKEEGLNITQIESTFRNHNDVKIGKAIDALKSFGYIVQQDSTNKSEKRHFLMVSAIQELQGFFNQ